MTSEYHPRLVKSESVVGARCLLKLELDVGSFAHVPGSARSNSC